MKVKLKDVYVGNIKKVNRNVIRQDTAYAIGENNEKVPVTINKIDFRSELYKSGALLLKRNNGYVDLGKVYTFSDRLKMSRPEEEGGLLISKERNHVANDCHYVDEESLVKFWESPNPKKISVKKLQRAMRNL